MPQGISIISNGDVMTAPIVGGRSSKPTTVNMPDRSSLGGSATKPGSSNWKGSAPPKILIHSRQKKQCNFQCTAF